MALVPLKYPLRSVWVRRSSALFSAFGIACTVGVLSAILALQNGFSKLFEDTVPDDLAIYLRPGSTSEGESAIRRDQADMLMKERSEIERTADGKPMAAAETFLAIFHEKLDGGSTNVPIRGIQEMTKTLHGDALRLVEGEWFRFGTNELCVGRSITTRIKSCRIGETFVLNTTPFKVVGVFEHDGPHGAEIWGDAEQMIAALDRPFYQRIIARMKPGTDVAKVAVRLADDKRAPAKMENLREHLRGQKSQLSTLLGLLGGFIGAIMGVAAILGATTTMLASVGSRTREVGILLALGYGRLGILLAFLFEAALIGLGGGLFGCAGTFLFNGIETGTMNGQTFTEATFAFRVDAPLLAKALVFSVVLGILGGVVPAWRAARLTPTVALRRH